ncbi:MAG: DUF3572 domain-containing protein [Xanthobacteraceae bacterium]|nr:DUF3572 domain-containing protein [Xanthobacteraceae bacterium]PWB59513.1 MAG: DUF3572 domain-containing protein [Bradyrhizobiaceae bacterium]
MTRESAESLAVEALAFLAAEPDRLGPFLAATGIAPETIRASAAEPGFLAGVLDHILADERLLLAFVDAAAIAPEAVGRARARLGRPYEPDIP